MVNLVGNFILACEGLVLPRNVFIEGEIVPEKIWVICPENPIVFIKLYEALSLDNSLHPEMG